MPLVTIEPDGLRIEVEAGEALAQAAWRQGYHWPTTCWGEAQCMVCAVVITAGEMAAEPATPEEEAAIIARMPHFRRQPGTRLACRLRVLADGLVVEKAGVRGPHESDASCIE